MNIKDYKWTEKRFGTRFAKILKGLGFSEENTEDIKVTDANGKLKTLVTDSNFKSILAKNGTLTEVTWQELKDKRDAGKLTPGALYRITDYQCTTTQENTRSAGHQFDIVLLALSEDKLAEEGWAMEHPTDVYDVTFSDGVTKKCWLYNYTLDYYTIVDIETNLGLTNLTVGRGDIIVNNATKTATTPAPSNAMTNPNLPYNYFQNSNLSAWKVWYCLDNDKSRFAWADDREGYLISGQSQLGIWDNQLILRAPGWDAHDIYGWEIVGTDVAIFTKTLDINVGQIQIYNSSGNLIGVATVSSAIKVYNGRGVIYRLIDEWNNDVPYDFKNIQFVRPMTNGEYTPGGEDTWVYTFSLNVDEIVVDATIPDERGRIWASHNIVNADFELPDNVFFGNAKSCFVSLGSNTNTIIDGISVILHNTVELYDNDGAVHGAVIYLNNKKVLTES